MSKFHYEQDRVFVESPFSAAKYISLAKQLGYSSTCQNILKECKTHSEVARILKGARNGEY